MEKEKFVRDIVQGILDKDGLDTNRVIDIQLDDHGAGGAIYLVMVNDKYEELKD